MERRYDIVVVGGGHAGAEAAWAAARLGAHVAMVTMDRAAIGRMSCNPAIGGLGKGQIVREIDALGGLMGLVADEAGIQFRILNKSKGAAVWGPRAQADRELYARVLRRRLEEVRNIDVVEGVVEGIITASQAGVRRVSGVTLAGSARLACDAVVLTTGTFLRGLIHCGEQQSEGGRIGEAASVKLSDSLRAMGFELGRLKTGTPPRVDRDTVAYDQTEIQEGDRVPTPFSFMNDTIAQSQVPCWITYTNLETHAVVRRNLHRAPMYSGQIASVGPRYCPSIEDKVVRFADRPRHQVFLEPEGRDSEWVYCNGISTSLPKEIQAAMLETIGGLGEAKVVQYGYAIEYDYVPSHQVRSTLETKSTQGLYLAGQINGTSGYEEAAGQGLIAGANAACRLLGRDSVTLGRDQAYIGVMIDDLITKPPTEPYRMFTSRAEYRLALRSDNADLRLTPVGRKVGLVDDTRWHHFERRRDEIEELSVLAGRLRYGGRLVADILKRPETSAETFAAILKRAGVVTFRRDILEQVVIASRYAGYLARQACQIETFRQMESTRIPPQVDFASVPGLRTEARQALATIGPTTLGQASRIPGISPADVAVLCVCVAACESYA